MYETIHFWSTYDKITIASMFQFLTHVELLRSMATILEVPQYVAYQENVSLAFVKLGAKSDCFNTLCTMDVFTCPFMNDANQCELVHV